MMTTVVNATEEARAKIARLQRSSKYRTFLNAQAIQAFRKVEEPAFAGQPLFICMSDGPPTDTQP